MASLVIADVKKWRKNYSKINCVAEQGMNKSKSIYEMIAWLFKLPSIARQNIITLNAMFSVFSDERVKRDG
jgi:hypothetical protein